MATNNSDFKQADELAAQYDEAANKYGWYAPEILFGLIYDRLEAGQCLLDLGIGTGLSSVLFNKAGLRIHGLDGSRQMLDHATARDVAVELKQHDLLSTPLPYPESQFDHVVACGVFHLVDHLNDVFSEAARVSRDTGTFVFTTEELEPDAARDSELAGEGVLEIKNETSGVLSYMHSDILIATLLHQNGFTITKALDFVAYRKTEWSDERTFRAYVAVKSEME